MVRGQAFSLKRLHAGPMNNGMPRQRPTFLLQAAQCLHAGWIDRAARLYQWTLRNHPEQDEAWHGLGLVALARGDATAAVVLFQSAIARRTDEPAYFHDLGRAWRQMGRKSEAVVAFLHAAELDHRYFDALFDLGSVLCELLRPAEGAQALRLALHLRPEHPDAHLLLGMCLERLGQVDAATEQYLAVLRLRGGDARAYLMLGGALFKAGHVAEADFAFTRSLALDPDQPHAHSRRIAAMNYRADLTAREIADAHRDWGRRFAAPLRFAAVDLPPGEMPDDPARPLRIGYVSPNLFRHSVAHFLLPVLRGHDRAAVEVFCYSNSAMVDGTTRALRDAADHWREVVGRSDEEVAALVRADRIDILVDLAGHTGDNRLLVFARRPAPVQVSWLGYPQTTGMEAIDYRLSDDITEPLGESDALGTETVVRLPSGFHCFGRPGEDGPGDGCEGETLDVGPPPVLANGFVTFGSFNSVQKMPPALVALWARVLAAVPGSRLLLKSLPDRVIADRYHNLFAAWGINPERIEFLHWTPSRAEHLRLYGRMDIALDTFPYHGTTTTCEALWMGVPVLSLCGDRHASRVGTSLLTRAGLPAWIAVDEDDYVAKAAAHAACLTGLTLLKTTLRDRMRASALCNTDGFVHDLEVAYREMWQARRP